MYISQTLIYKAKAEAKAKKKKAFHIICQENPL